MNPYLAHPNNEVALEKFEFVCEICHFVNSGVRVTLKPTLAYKIDNGFLLRKYALITPEQVFCVNCSLETDGASFWLFWKHLQGEEGLLRQILDLQNEFIDTSHHVFNLPAANESPS